MEFFISERVRDDFFFRMHRCDFRERLKYRRNPEHKPKAKDQAREAWRKRKGFKRDRSRQYDHPYKKHAKKWSNRYHRQWERLLLNKGRDEEFFRVKRKDLFDPWLWD